MEMDTDPLGDFESGELIQFSLRCGELYVDEPAPFSKEKKADIIKQMVKINCATYGVPRSSFLRLTKWEPITHKETTSGVIDLTSDSTESGRKKRKTSPLRGDSETFDSDVVARALQKSHPNDDIVKIIGDLVEELSRVSSLISRPVAVNPVAAIEENVSKGNADAETETPIWWDFGFNRHVHWGGGANIPLAPLPWIAYDKRPCMTIELPCLYT